MIYAPLAWQLFPYTLKISPVAGSHVSHIPTITPRNGGEKRTKLFVRVKSAPNHKNPEAKNLLHLFLSEIILSSGVYNYTGTTRLWRMRSQSSLHEPPLKSDRNQHELRTPSSPSPLQLNPCLQMAVYQLSCWGHCLHVCHWTPGVAWQTFRGGCPLLGRREDEESFCLFSCTGNVNLKISWESAQAVRQGHLCSGFCFCFCFCFCFFTK